MTYTSSTGTSPKQASEKRPGLTLLLLGGPGFALLVEVSSSKPWAAVCSSCDWTSR